ncbi:dioxygenase [Catenovulum agarivorans DS-2]|uniref:Dioxygenase n=1 Tax=Catenovulum agarivorans DS-2 TaxID=1328313 RepID=W7QIF4_9ALTE|nr:AmmeMemoRadiSam system protein A [Catenovulum agarivorans]EWH08707.1 dioxygenase [Catenovulum agarivorans DS-2]
MVATAHFAQSEFEQPEIAEHIIQLVKDALEYAYQHNQSRLPERLVSTHPVLAKPLACFVSLNDHSGLRGCVGTTVANGRLDKNIAWYAHEAAFHDPRFDPIPAKDFAELTCVVSIMSMPLALQADDEQQLLQQLIPQRDGLIIQYGQASGVFLPCMWTQYPDAADFLQALKQKAGWPEHGWTHAMKASVFQTYRISGALS